MIGLEVFQTLRVPFYPWNLLVSYGPFIPYDHHWPWDSVKPYVFNFFQYRTGLIELKVFLNLTSRLCLYPTVIIDLETLSNLETCQYLTGILEPVVPAVWQVSKSSMIVGRSQEWYMLKCLWNYEISWYVWFLFLKTVCILIAIKSKILSYFTNLIFLLRFVSILRSCLGLRFFQASRIPFYPWDLLVSCDLPISMQKSEQRKSLLIDDSPANADGTKPLKKQWVKLLRPMQWQIELQPQQFVQCFDTFDLKWPSFCWAILFVFVFHHIHRAFKN